MYRRLPTYVSAVLLGTGLESFMLGWLSIYKPDPPLGMADVVLIGSQLPSLFLANQITMYGVFLFQACLFSALFIPLLRFAGRLSLREEL